MTHPTESTSHDHPVLGRRMAAAALAVGPGMLLVGSLLVPSEVDEPVNGDRATALRHLAIAAQHRSAVLTGYLVVVAALVVLAPAFPVLATLVDGRGRRTVTTGAAVTAVAVAIGAAVNLNGLTLYRATDPSLSREASAQLLTVPSGIVVLVLTYVALFPIGMTMLAVGFWRSRQFPRMPAVLLAVAAIAHIMSPAGPVGAALTVPLVVAAAILSRRLWLGRHSLGGRALTTAPTVQEI